MDTVSEQGAAEKLERVELRLPTQKKRLLESAAAMEGKSRDAFIIDLLASISPDLKQRFQSLAS